MTEPDRSPPGDELTERYREASAQDTRRPGAHVRGAVRAHAQMVLDAGKAQGANAATNTAQTKEPAANQSRWKISALASIALAGLTGLLVLQFDRGNDEEKDLVFGQRSASTPPAAAPAPAPAPAAAPATTTPQAPPSPQPEARAKARVAESPPASALKEPATPAAKKSAEQPRAPGQAAPKAEAETAQAPGGAAPPAAAPAPAPPPTQDSAGYSVSGRTAGAAASPQAPAPPAPTVQADISAPAAVARSAAPAAPPAPAMAAAAPPAPMAAAPAAAAPAAAAAAEQRQEKSAAPARSLRAEATGSLGLASALQQSARAGDLQQLERLLRQGAPLNAADPAGRTPLILAVMQGHTAVVQRLLAAGANTALIDKDGLNALQHARRLGFDGIAHLIETAP